MRNILVLFDSLSIRSEAVQYAIELAKRTDCELVILMLLWPEINDETPSSLDFSDEERLRVQDALYRQAEQAEQTGVAVRALIKTGDPQSEVMKFLAGSSTTQAIVWGGSPDLMDQKAQQKRSHWLVKTKSMVECPVVIPSMKS